MSYQRNLQRLALLSTTELETSAVDREIKIPIPITQEGKKAYRGRLIKAIARTDRRDHRNEHRPEVPAHYGSEEDEDNSIVDNALDAMHATSGEEDVDKQNNDDEDESEMKNFVEDNVTEKTASTDMVDNRHTQRDRNLEDKANSTTKSSTDTQQNTVQQTAKAKSTRFVEEMSDKEELSLVPIPTSPENEVLTILNTDQNTRAIIETNEQEINCTHKINQNRT